jgi:iron transport multicopper oxidase
VFYINFDQHEAFVIETDGVEVEPYPIDTLTISIGQRYSLLIKAKDSTSTNYALSINQSEDM